MLITFRNALSPKIDELLRCALHFDPAIQLLVFGPKRDLSFLDTGDPTLRDGRTPCVASSISEEMLFGLEGLDLDTPPAFFEMSEQVFHLVNGQLRTKLPGPQGCAEKRDHRLPPRLHQRSGP
jgi:hypothetical protein